MDHKVSRRSFIKGGALLGASAALLGTLGGCSNEEEKKGAPTNTFTTPGGRTYVLHEADIIVVGSGTAGATAARIANNSGASVIIVDKGPVGHSGNTGLLWGQSFVTAEGSTDTGEFGAEFLTFDVMGILDQEHARNVINAQIEGQPRAAIEQSGNIVQRNEDGSVFGLIEGNGILPAHGTLWRQACQMLVRRGIPIFDNTIMVDILQDEEGNASGIVGLNFEDGSAHVFRGKKIILCTGGYHWAAGPTAGSPESTGEGHAALLRRGLKFKDMEFPQFDFSGIRPFGWRPDPEKDQLQIGISMSVNGEVQGRMRNKDKKGFSRYFFDNPDVADVAGFQGAMITSARELINGGGTPGDGSGNGLLFDLHNIKDEPFYAHSTYAGHIENVEHNMNFRFPDYYETIPNQYSSCGIPALDPKTNETEIPNLYTAFVALSAMSSTFSFGQAYLAAKDASAKVAQENLPGYSPDEVEEILSKAYRYLEADHPDGIRAIEVHRNIQRAFYKGLGFLKNEKDMQASLDEFVRIKEEDIPRMICADKSKCYNRDWKLALEADSMLLCSMGTAHAAMARKESRSPHFRTDYPKMDNENFLAFIWTSVDEQGNWNTETGDIVTTLVPKEVIIEELGTIDISEPNQYEDQ